MIQRIQSVYLLLAALINIGLYFTPIYHQAWADPDIWIGYGLAISLLIAALLSLFSIFRYNNRPDQKSWVKRSMLFQLIALAFAAGVLVSMGGWGRFLWDEGLSTLGILLGLLFQYLALRGIESDEELVRSMDRIR